LSCALACASSPPPGPKIRRPPCQPAAAIGEAYRVGARGVLKFGSDSTIEERRPPHLDEPLPEVVLEDVAFEHTSLGRGARSDVMATYRAPRGARLVLEGKTSVAGYEIRNLWVDAGAGERSFWVGCFRDRPRHTVRWSFALRDPEGRRSNVIEVPVECTGGEIPGTPPVLLGVEMDRLELLGGERASGVARFTGSQPPLHLSGSTSVAGYGFTSPAFDEDQGEYRFWVGCYGDRPAHLVKWTFRVRDTYGRESAMIERIVACGECR
jgi:hypothetical protein